MIRVVLAFLLAAAPAAYEIETVAEGLEHPWSLAFLPDGRMLVTERAGRLRIIDADGRLSPEPVAGVPEAYVSGQAGLKEVAPAPDFADSGVIYLTYACGTRRANNTCLARGRLDGDRLVGTREIFRARPEKQGNAHYGGRIAFLPDDTLLLTLGDGFDYREEAQNPGNHLGTVVRLARDGTAPRDNPFVGDRELAPEVFTYGHRNVQGIVYDAANRRIIIHEHGPRGGDEINVLEPGANYGWPAVSFGIDYTGAMITPYQSLPQFRPPALHWTPSIAPSGMTLYDGDLFPDWQGDLLVSALAADKGVHRIRFRLEGRATPAEVLFAELDERIRDVRTGPDGALYLLTDSDKGRVLRVTPAGD